MTATPTAAAYVALGSNIGDRAAYLAGARDGLATLPGTRLTRASAVEETAPVGPSGQGAYLNQMLRLDTTLAPSALLAAGQALERAAGRRRDPAARWGPRTLDVDIVLYGDEVIASPDLDVPHPALAQRDFWQRELAELGVDWRAVLGALHATPHAARGAAAT